MEGDIAMEEWKDPNRGGDSLMPGFMAEPFTPPDACLREGGSKAGFEKHDLSVAVGTPLPLTPPFCNCKNSGSGRGSLAERLQARAGFSFPKLCVPCAPPAAAAAAERSPSGAPSPYVTIPPGLSPTTLLESPIFLSNAMAQASPTTGKLHTLGGANENDPTRFEVSQLEDSHCDFSFRPSELKPSPYTAEERMESLSNNRHPSLPNTEATVKTEANIQTAHGANLPSQSHLMQQQFNGQTAVKSSSSRICNLSHPAPDTVLDDGDGASPPDHGQPAATTEGDAKVDCAAVVAAAPAEDGYSWRKYGQKQVKHSDRRPPGDTQMDHAPPDGSNPHAAAGGQPNVEARPLWHNGVAVQDWRGEGVEATSSPSVPGELSDSAASMQVHDGSAARRFESPEGVDATSAVSDEVERDDGGTHASMPQAAADGESDELERKRSGHPVSAAPGGGGVAGSVVGSLQPHSGGVGSRRPELPSVQDSLMGLPFAPFGLRRMGNFPYSSGHAASLPLPSIPLPAGLSGMDGLNFPMLAPPVHPLFRHRQGIETAGLMVPKGEVKEEAMPANSSGAGAGHGAVYQQAMNRLPLGHQL
ncbi:hypothetical protein ABZP36_008192 [Zizania latifolia]